MKTKLADGCLFLHVATVLFTLFVIGMKVCEAAIPVGVPGPIRPRIPEVMPFIVPLPFLAGMLYTSANLRFHRPRLRSLFLLHVPWLAWLTWYGWFAWPSFFRVHEVVANPEDFEHALRALQVEQAIIYSLLVGLYSGVPLGIYLMKGLIVGGNASVSSKRQRALKAVAVISGLAFGASIIAARVRASSWTGTTNGEWQTAIGMFALLAVSYPCSQDNKFALRIALAMVSALPLLDFVTWIFHH
jgi:hypothetical protein